jgi:hypothetical protein
MNRKRKINDLYKGVFKNNKKSNLIDLKPFQEHNEIKEFENNSKKYELKTKFKYENLQKTKEKHINAKLKVAKNLGFGNYFQRLRKRIIDIFLDDKELISYENMFKQKEVRELFNIKNSVQNDNNYNSFKNENKIPNSGIFYYNHESNKTNNLDYYQIQSDYLNKGTEQKFFQRKKYDNNYTNSILSDINYDDRNNNMQNYTFMNNPFIPSNNNISRKNKYGNFYSNSILTLGNNMNNTNINNNLIKNRNDNLFYNTKLIPQSKESFKIKEVINSTKKLSSNFID